MITSSTKTRKKKSKGYNVVEGRNVLKTRNLDVGTTKGRKKKCSRECGKINTTLVRTPLNTVE